MRPRTALAAIACALVAGCGGDMRADELNRSIAQIESAAGDGELTALGVAEDRTKSTFVRAHAREISEQVDHEAEKLSDASATGDVAVVKRKAVELADELSSALGQLQLAPGDEDSARRTRADLRALADRAEQLRAEL
ncbi:MAG TPA: hypothetical protein VF712_20415 [Thermoleophilaceae bacterium]|jgi:predicted outer membrane protein